MKGRGDPRKELRGSQRIDLSLEAVKRAESITSVTNQII